ncbi:MAG: hypothetical protein ACJLS2_02295 [Microcella pacifica]
MSDLFPFTASNGTEVTTHSDGYLVAVSSAGATEATSSPVRGMTALRELFQAERDASLGRWRSKEHPDYVVYQDPENADSIFLLDESAPEWVQVERPQGGRLSEWNEGIWAVAREFFAAHPEPKPPWHDAKPGEVWVLTYGGQPTAHVYTDRTAEGLAFLSDRAIVSADDPDITAGRRIFPEVNS